MRFWSWGLTWCLRVYTSHKLLGNSATGCGWPHWWMEQKKLQPSCAAPPIVQRCLEMRKWVAWDYVCCLRSHSQLAQKSGKPGSFLFGELTATKICDSPVIHSGNSIHMPQIHFCCWGIDFSSLMKSRTPCLGNDAAHSGMDLSTSIN